MSISDFGVDIFLCTNNIHFSKCVYTALSLNLYTSTLSSCNSRDYGLHFMDEECQRMQLCSMF